MSVLLYVIFHNPVNTRRRFCTHLIYTAVVTRDISRRHRIRNKALFDRVVRFIIENVGKTFSANSIVKLLKGEKRSLSVETIYNYLKWLQESMEKAG